MGVRTVLEQFLGDEVTVVVECRQCGTTVAPKTDECDACGATAFCRYEISE